MLLVSQFELLDFLIFWFNQNDFEKLNVCSLRFGYLIFESSVMWILEKILKI